MEEEDFLLQEQEDWEVKWLQSLGDESQAREAKLLSSPESKATVIMFKAERKIPWDQSEWYMRLKEDWTTCPS